jgi:hypothetical protein
MPNLPEKIAVLEEQLAIANEVEKAIHIQGELEAIYIEFDSQRKSLSEILLAFNVLQDLPADAPTKLAIDDECKSKLSATCSLVNAFVEKWKIENYAARQGNELNKASKSLASTLPVVVVEIEHAWRDWVESIESKFALEDALLESQKSIPGMKVTYDEYRVDRSKFNELSGPLPKDRSVFESLQKHAAHLGELRAKMHFDLPSEVENFFAALNQNYGGRVALDLLTPAVIDWIKEKNLMREFTVQRTGSILR